jgi:hypothetical protein
VTLFDMHVLLFHIAEMRRARRFSAVVLECGGVASAMILFDC